MVTFTWPNLPLQFPRDLYINLVGADVGKITRNADPRRRNVETHVHQIDRQRQDGAAENIRKVAQVCPANRYVRTRRNRLRSIETGPVHHGGRVRRPTRGAGKRYRSPPATAVNQYVPSVAPSTGCATAIPYASVVLSALTSDPPPRAVHVTGAFTTGTPY